MIEDFERDKTEDYNYYRIYALGEWGKLRTGGEFWKNYSYEKHVKEVEGTNHSYSPHMGRQRKSVSHVSSVARARRRRGRLTRYASKTRETAYTTFAWSL